jgi:hypothetical protein
MGKEDDNYQKCEAPIHSIKCDGRGDTEDHFTPKCIAKLWKWKQKEINSPENIQYLSRACHDEKDKTTEARLTLLRQQLKGVYISLEYYKTVDDPNFDLKREKPKLSKKEIRRRKRRNIRQQSGKTNFSRGSRF